MSFAHGLRPEFRFPNAILFYLLAGQVRGSNDVNAIMADAIRRLNNEHIDDRVYELDTDGGGLVAQLEMFQQVCLVFGVLRPRT